jgi:hypothetical protein
MLPGLPTLVRILQVITICQRLATLKCKMQGHEVHKEPQSTQRSVRSAS